MIMGRSFLFHTSIGFGYHHSWPLKLFRKHQGKNGGVASGVVPHILFLDKRDLTYARLKESTSYSGFNPCLCFKAGDATRCCCLHS